MDGLFTGNACLQVISISMVKVTLLVQVVLYLSFRRFYLQITQAEHHLYIK